MNSLENLKIPIGPFFLLFCEKETNRGARWDGKRERERGSFSAPSGRYTRTCLSRWLVFPLLTSPKDMRLLSVSTRRLYLRNSAQRNRKHILRTECCLGGRDVSPHCCRAVQLLYYFLSGGYVSSSWVFASLFSVSLVPLMCFVTLCLFVCLFFRVQEQMYNGCCHWMYDSFFLFCPL